MKAVPIDASTKGIATNAHHISPLIYNPLILFIGLLLTALFDSNVHAAERARNVIVILADDLGWGDLGCYGHQKFKTPNLDRMAAEGARLTNFYAACPFCAPTRASLMTGRYPHRCGMTGNPFPAEDYGGAGNRAGDELGLPTTEKTLADVFLAAGYRTACIGKWHLGHKPQFLPNRRGFDEYFGILYSNDMHPVELFDNEQRVEFPVEQTTLTRRYTDRALQFLEQNKSRPFFLYFPHAMPHKPLAAGKGYYEKSGEGLYADVIAELDASVGQVLAKLKELDLERQTKVFFTSDNGPWFGGSSGGLRGMKGHCWEGGIRVPLIARQPGAIPPGHVSHEPAIMMDVFATALAATGVPLPQDRTIDGRDIGALFTSNANSPHSSLVFVQGKPRAIRKGLWKLHVGGTPAAGFESLEPNWTDPRAPNGKTILAPSEQYKPSAFPGLKTGDRSTSHALFNLANDPTEQTNVAAKHPDVVKELLAEFEPLSKVDVSSK